MFRKGGDVGGGIMDNVVERRNYAKSNAEDFTSLSDRIKFQPYSLTTDYIL